MVGLDETLKQRGEQYGDYVAMSETIQSIKDVFRSNLAWGTLHAGQKEALEMMATKIGRLLLIENVASLNARYPTDYAEMLPDGFNPDTYRFEPDYFFETRVQNMEAAAIDLAACYEYQSCEHDGWETSYAKRFTDWLTYQAAKKWARRTEVGLKTWEYIKPADAPKIVSLSDLIGKRA